MFRATNSPILRSTFWLYIQLLVQFTDTAANGCHGWDGTDVPSQPWHRSAAVSVRCTKSCIYIQKVLLRMGEFLARNICRAELKRLINEKFVACCRLKELTCCNKGQTRSKICLIWSYSITYLRGRTGVGIAREWPVHRKINLVYFITELVKVDVICKIWRNLDTCQT